MTKPAAIGSAPHSQIRHYRHVSASTMSDGFFCDGDAWQAELDGQRILSLGGFCRRFHAVTFNMSPFLAIRTLIVPAILSVVASIHMFQWYSLDRSSWGTGAGFGMFATVDYHGSRFLRCYGITAQGEYPIQFPEEFKELGLSARVIPTRERLAKLASRLLACEWSATSSSPESVSSLRLVPSSNARQTDTTVQVDGVRVELWGVQIDASRRTVESYIINLASMWKNSAKAGACGGS